MIVAFFSAFAEKSVYENPTPSLLSSNTDAHLIAIVFVVAAFAAVRTVHAVARPHSLLFWLMMLS